MSIDIGTVLSRFDDTFDEADFTVKSYGIKFVTADGRVRTMRCRKNVKSPHRGLNKPVQERGKQSFNLKRNGTMLVHDLTLDEPRYVKVSMIFSFMDHNASTWHDVRH